MSYLNSFQDIQVTTLSQECGSAESTIETLVNSLKEIANLVDDLYDDNADFDTRMAAIAYEVALGSAQRHKDKVEALRAERQSFLDAMEG